MLILSQRIVMFSGAWALLSLMLLAFAGSLGIESFFVLYLLGFFVILMLLGPGLSRPGWRGRASVAVSIGVLIFGLFLVNEIFTILHITLF